MDYTIYVLENVALSMSYVGRTKHLHTRRWTGKTKIGQAIARHGLASFNLRILDIAHGQREAIIKERLYVHLFESNDPRFGYNNPNQFINLEPNRHTLPVNPIPA